MNTQDRQHHWKLLKLTEEAKEQPMVTIKPTYQDTVIAFGNSGIVLSKRPHEDLIDLALMAHSSRDPTLLKLFENLPTVDQLKRLKMEGIIRKQSTKE